MLKRENDHTYIVTDAGTVLAWRREGLTDVDAALHRRRLRRGFVETKLVRQPPSLSTPEGN